MIGLLIYLRYSKANSVAATLVRSYEERNGSMGVFGANNTEKRFTDEANKRWVRVKLRRIYFTRRERRVLKKINKGRLEIHQYMVTSKDSFDELKEDMPSLMRANNKILTALDITSFEQGLEYYGCTGLTNFCEKSQKAI